MTKLEPVDDEAALEPVADNAKLASAATGSGDHLATAQEDEGGGPVMTTNGRTPASSEVAEIAAAANRWATARRTRELDAVTNAASRWARARRGADRRAGFEALVASAVRDRGAVPAWAIWHPIGQQALTASARPGGQVCERHGPTGTKVCRPCLDALDEGIEW